MKNTKNYWLLKNEEDCYSIDDFKKDKSTLWEGVRNYQARNFLRDTMQKGDGFLYYRSGKDPAVVGVGKIMSDALPDPTAMKKGDEYYDAKSTKENPIWFTRKVQFVKKLSNPVSLKEIKFDPKLNGMPVTQRGNRLSVQPVSENHFKYILEKIK